MPVYNERTVVERCLSQVLSCAAARNDGTGAGDRGRPLDGRHLGHPHPAGRTAAGDPPVPPRSEHGEGRGGAHRHQAGRRRFLHHTGRRSRVRSRRIPSSAQAAAGRPRRRGVRVALPGGRADARAAVLAFGDQQGADADLEHVLQPRRHRYGDLLQGLPHRPVEEHSHPFEPVRLRAGNHHEVRQAEAARLRSAHQLSRADVRGREEDRLEGRRQGAADRAEVLGDRRPLRRTLRARHAEQPHRHAAVPELAGADRAAASRATRCSRWARASGTSRGG